MAAEPAIPGGSAGEPFTWVHCAGCGKGLWRRYADRVVMRLSPRGRQVRTITVPLTAAHSVRVHCEKCGTVAVLDESQ